MTDIMSKEKRSQIMSKIRGKNTGIEKTLLKYLKKNKIKGFTYQPKMFGNPDIAFKKKRVAIFCDGEFWHGHKFEEWKNKIPNFWIKKIEGNIKRDKMVRNKLKKSNWKVLRFWGKKIVNNPCAIIKKIQKTLRDVDE